MCKILSNLCHRRRGAILWNTLLLVAPLPCAVEANDVLISEFMAVNDGFLADEDGEFSDWIELHSTANVPVNLDGWHLTDDATDRRKFRLPAIVLEPGDYLLVFASGKDRAEAEFEVHANFRLSGGGEYLALVRPDGTVADEFAPAFTRQREDFSYGLLMDLTELVPRGAAATVSVPRASLGLAWTGVGYNDATWRRGPTGVGYDTAPAELGESAPAAYWAFDDDVRDLSGHGRDGELVGPEFSTDVPAAIGAGASLALDGADDFVRIPGYKGVTGSQARTLSAWIRTGQTNTSILSWGTNSGGRKWTFRVQTGNGQPGALRVEVNGGYVVGNTVLTDNEWHHVACVLPGDETPELNSVHLYVDGVLDAWAGGTPRPSAVNSRSIDTASIEDVRVGTDFQNRLFSGHIDDVAIWEEALTGAQIAALASGVSPLDLKSYDGLVQTDVESELRGVNATAYIRLPFQVEAGLFPDSLSLRMQYDDGFVAYLNGQEVASRNAPAVASWNSAAVEDRPGFEAFVPEEFNVSSALDVVGTGANVLAIHGLNDSPGSSDFLILPELVAARVRDGETRYFKTPTPGAANGAGVIDFVADLLFSHQPGFYERPFQVSLMTATPGAIIRYTTDGSAPTATTGELYGGPIRVEDTTTLRAAAFRDGYEPSYVDTRTYIFIQTADARGGVLSQPADPAGFPPTWGTQNSNPIVADYEMDPRFTTDTTSPYYDPRVKDALLSLPTLSLVMDLDDLFDPRTGIYSNSTRSGVEWERPTSVELIFPDGREGFQINAGLRIQGGASRSPSRPKHNLRLLFKKIYGAGKLRYRLFEDTPVDRFDTIVLRGGNGDSWFHPRVEQQVRAQYIRDQWHRDTQLAMGRLTAHQAYMHLYINGLYWGMYHIFERPSAPFLAEYLGGDEDEYDALNLGEPIDGDLRAWNEMMRIATSGVGSAEHYEEIQQYLDVPNLIDFLLVNYYSGNFDWDHNNWYAGRRRVPGAGWKFFCWDAERSFWNLNENRVGINNANRPTGLHTRLMANPDYMALFADHVQRHFFHGGTLTPEAAEARWMARAREIELALVAEAARWGDDKRPAQPYTPEREWLAELNWLRSTYFPQRTEIVLRQLQDRGLYPTSSEPPHLEPPGGRIPSRAVGLEVTMSVAAGTIYYTLDGSDPRLPGGDVNPDAAIYREPITLAGTTHVQARTLRRGEWSALIEAVYALDASSLRITELMYHPRDPAGPDPLPTEDFEFAELYNAGSETLDLAGVRFVDGIDFLFSATGVRRLDPGQYVVVVKNLEAFTTRHDTVGMLIGGEYGGNFANGGETVTLVDALGETILSFTYSDLWHPTTDGGGFSLEILDPTQGPETWNEAASWRPSSVRDGTPGQADDPSLGGRQLPGNITQDRSVDISDAISLLGHLFLGSPSILPCGDGNPADEGNQMLLNINGDRGVDLTDAVTLLTYLFQGGPPPVLGVDCIRMPGCPDACE